MKFPKINLPFRKIGEIKEKDLEGYPEFYRFFYLEQHTGWCKVVVKCWLVFVELGVFGLALLQTGFWYAITGNEYLNILHWAKPITLLDPGSADAPFTWILNRSVALSFFLGFPVYLMSKTLLVFMELKIVSLYLKLFPQEKHKTAQVGEAEAKTQPIIIRSRII